MTFLTLQTTPTDSKELAHRANDGVEVTLLWSKREDRLFVRVRDARSGDSFELAAAAADALDIYEHPYAYAAFRGIDYSAGDGRQVEAIASTGACR